MRAELAEADRAVPESVHEAKTLGRLVEGLNGRITALEAQERALRVPSELLALIEPGADVEKRWKAAPVSAKRKIAEILLTPAYLGEVRLTRSSVKGIGVPAEQRMVWRRGG